MKRILLSTLAVALLWHASHTCLAKDEPAAPAAGDAAAMKPVVVVSLSGYDRIMSSIAYIGKLSDNPELDKNLEGLLKLFTQGQGVNGLDKKRPWGAALNTDGVEFRPLIFIPVVQLDQLLKSLAPLSAVGEAKDIGNGVFELQNGNMKLYVKEHNGWAFVGQLPESLEKLPENPLKLLGGLDRRYEVAVRLYVRNVPEMYRSMIIDQLKATVQAASERQADEEETEFESRRKLVEAQMAQLTTKIKETDQVTIGWGLNQKTNVSYLDFRMTAIPDSETARQFANIAKVPTHFLGFLLPDAAATYHTASKLDERDVEYVTSAIKTMRPRVLREISQHDKLPDEATKKVAQEIVSEMFDVVEGTLKAGRMDAGAALSLAGNKIALAVGIFVADPMAVERSLKKVMALAKEKDPEFPGMKFDAQRLGDVRLHTMVVPIKNNKDAVRVFGNELELSIGIGEQSVYFGLGKDSIPLLKGAIDKSKTSPDKAVLPAQLNIALAPVIDFIAAINKQKHADEGKVGGDTEEAASGDATDKSDDKSEDKSDDKADANDGAKEDAEAKTAETPDRTQAILAMMAAELAKVPGKDHVRILMQPIKNGVATRILVEEGVLKLLGQASKMMGPVGGPVGPQ